MEDFVEYVQRYCREYGVEPVEAVKHKIVRLVGYYYGLTITEIMDVSSEIKV